MYTFMTEPKPPLPMNSSSSNSVSSRDLPMMDGLTGEHPKMESLRWKSMHSFFKDIPARWTQVEIRERDKGGGGGLRDRGGGGGLRDRGGGGGLRDRGGGGGLRDRGGGGGLRDRGGGGGLRDRGGGGGLQDRGGGGGLRDRGGGGGLRDRSGRERGQDNGTER